MMLFDLMIFLYACVFSGHANILFYGKKKSLYFQVEGTTESTLGEGGVCA
jgi:hypothetical protein